MNNYQLLNMMKREEGNPSRTRGRGQAREAAKREDEDREASGGNAAKRRREGRLTDHLHDHQRKSEGRREDVVG